MISTRLTPRVIKLMLACEVLLLAGLTVSAKLGLTPRMSLSEVVVGLSFGTTARLIAIKLYLNVANEYRDARLSRLVWLAFAFNSVLLVPRALVSNDIVAALTNNYYQTPLRGLLNHVFS